MKTSHACARLLAASMIVCGAATPGPAIAAADPADDSAVVSNSADQPAAPLAPAPGPQLVPVSDPGADPAAAEACSKFAEALDNAANGYGSYADSLEDQDGTAAMSNGVGRTSLRTSAGAAMDAANTPGLPPDIADPMRAWSMGAAKLMVKVGLNMTGGTLDDTAIEVNNNAEAVQFACAAHGTHA